MKSLKKAGAIGLAALAITGAGKSTLASNPSNKGNEIVEVLKSTPENKVDKETYKPEVSEFKEDSTSITKTLSEVASLVLKVSEFYTEEELNTKIHEIANKHPHFDMLSYEVKKDILKEYFGEFITESRTRGDIMLVLMSLIPTCLLIYSHHIHHRKPWDPKLFG